MTVHEECIAVDWSGAATGAATKIWVARVVDGELRSLQAPGSREAVQALLLQRRQERASCLVGLDFAFGVPAWFATGQQWRSVAEVWHAAATDGERWLRESPPPFWGRPGVPRPHAASDGLRACERTFRGTGAPKSVFQIGGAGAVGTGSIRGMPMLTALRAAGWAIWPFDAAREHTVVEIYPRLFTGPVVKRSPDARAALLERDWPDLGGAFRATMVGSEDAFDAGLAARGMWRERGRGFPPVADPVLRLEGAIWPDRTTG